MENLPNINPRSLKDPKLATLFWLSSSAGILLSSCVQDRSIDPAFQAAPDLSRIPTRVIPIPEVTQDVATPAALPIPPRQIKRAGGATVEKPSTLRNRIYLKNPGAVEVVPDVSGANFKNLEFGMPKKLNPKIAGAAVYGAVEGFRKWKIPASLTLAQLALETAWGERYPAGSNNLFGIKYDDEGEYILSPNGKVRELIAAGVIDPIPFAYAITGIYATDPDYGQKLQKIIEDNDLTVYDQIAMKGGNI